MKELGEYKYYLIYFLKNLIFMLNLFYNFCFLHYLFSSKIFILI